MEDHRGLYSFGTGYRKMVLDNKVMLGMNVFADRKDRGSHNRIGFGLEAFSEKLETRANLYLGTSSRSLVSQGSNYMYYEKAVDGLDAEFGFPLVENRWLKLFGSYYTYDFKRSSNMHGWKVRLEAIPMDNIGCSFELKDDNKGKEDYMFTFRVNMPFEFSPQNIWKTSKSIEKNTQPVKSLKDRMLDKVKRDYTFSRGIESWKEEKVQESESEATTTVVGNLTNVQLVIRFPGNDTSPDADSDGYGEAGDDLEIDFLLTASATEASTGISFANATISTGWTFLFNTSASLADAPAGGTTRTTTGTDLDMDIPGGTADGTSFNITMDVTADGETTSMTFGPFIVGGAGTGNIINDAIINMI